MHTGAPQADGLSQAGPSATMLPMGERAWQRAGSPAQARNAQAMAITSTLTLRCLSLPMPDARRELARARRQLGELARTATERRELWRRCAEIEVQSACRPGGSRAAVDRAVAALDEAGYTNLTQRVNFAGCVLNWFFDQGHDTSVALLRVRDALGRVRRLRKGSLRRQLEGQLAQLIDSVGARP